MRKFIIKSLLNIISFYLVAHVLAILKLDRPETALFAGIVLALINLILRPLLVIVALPLNLLTAGLFILVINTWMVMLTGKIVPGLHIGGFWTAFATALIIFLFDLMLRPYYRKAKVSV